MDLGTRVDAGWRIAGPAAIANYKSALAASDDLHLGAVLAGLVYRGLEADSGWTLRNTALTKQTDPG